MRRPNSGLTPLAPLLSSTRVIALALALLAAYKAYAVYRLASRGISLFIDDAFYYLLIARNFAESGLPTFDGIHATNGFHPLWMLMLAAMYKVIGDLSPEETMDRSSTAAKTR